MLKNVHDGLVDPQLLFITDEAYFHLSGYVNSQNTRIWSDENPRSVHQIPLHDIKIGVWCAVSARRIIGPIFYHETVNSDRYVRHILEPFFEQLTDDERQYGYFQQDNATAHTARNSISALQEVFDDRIISTGLWPPRSPDLSVCDFYLWGNLKGKVYRNTSRTAEALQNEIRNVVASISADELQRVSQGFLRRCEACLRATGNHFEHFL
jgi:inhibitor of nuclear factor kappa-B kinase subunit alpha